MAPSERRLVRSLFLSDVHLGCKHSQASHLLEFLKLHRPRYLYVVGDFFDGWKLRRRWRWSPAYDAVLKQLLDLRRGGTRLYYAPGNHDAFMRPFLNHLTSLQVVEVRDRFIHGCADGGRFLVTHGDQFDKVEQSSQWLSVVASIAYDGLLSVNWLVNRLRGKKHSPYAFSSGVKRRVKFLVSHISDFEDQLVRQARELSCQGVICGHIHAPRIVELDGVTYCNTGDWVENCSALVEYEDGSLELVRADGGVIARREGGRTDDDTKPDLDAPRIPAPRRPARMPAPAAAASEATATRLAEREKLVA
jgi:UDP-2,3-diacylglucosamine pyrophosphatase LpxH